MSEYIRSLANFARIRSAAAYAARSRILIGTNQVHIRQALSICDAVTGEYLICAISMVMSMIALTAIIQEVSAKCSISDCDDCGLSFGSFYFL